MKTNKANIVTYFKNHKGLTLVELIIATVVMVMAVSGILMSYIRGMELSEIARNQSLALQAEKSRLEQLKNTPFVQIKPNFHGITFTSTDLNGIGVTYVDDSAADLQVIRSSFCWRQSNGRVVGEDQNLNGVLNVGEDKNGNGMIDSPATIVTSIYKVP